MLLSWQGCEVSVDPNAIHSFVSLCLLGCSSCPRGFWAGFVLKIARCCSLFCFVVHEGCFHASVRYAII